MNFLAPYSNLAPGVTKRDIEGSPEEELIACSTGCGREVEKDSLDDWGRCHACARKDVPTLREVENE